MTINSDKKYFRVEEGLEGCNLWDLYDEAPTPLEWHKELLNMQEKGIQIFSTPFNESTVDFLETLRCKFINFFI